MKVISTEKLPIKMWLPYLEDGAKAQAKNVANLPFAFKHIAIMPDSHQGYGMPIGGVMATEGVIVPNAVGVDIGCGMCAVKTSLTEIDTDTLKKIMGEIRKAIPVGFNRHEETQDISLMPRVVEDSGVVFREYENATKQLGTLGGGNHFIEIQKGDDGHIWIMIHSGSRNLGMKVATHYNKLAIEMNESYYSQVPKEWELAFLRVDTEEGQAYINEMNYCVDFALANRKLMMDRVCEVIDKITHANWDIEKGNVLAASFDTPINIAHNYATLESHFSKNVWIHRKGATLAREGTVGIIPGSMGTSSYIVEGKGNKDSFESCSHGAGRKMSRTKAKQELNLEEEQAKMGDIIGKPRGISDLDEAPGAYKDVKEVMSNQTDLVKIVTKLTPLAVIKG